MSEDDRFEAMSDLCIEAGRAVMQNGSEELKAIMRVALAVLGREIAQRVAQPVSLEAEPISIVRYAHS